MYLEIKEDSEFMKPVILIKKDHSELLTNSSLCLIKGETGSGKSRLAMNIMVGLSGNPDDLELEYEPCPDGKYVIYLSTEMSRYHLQRRLLKVLEQCPPEYKNKLKFFDLVNSDVATKFEDLTTICKEYPPYVIIIDQLGDFVNNINEIADANKLVSHLMNGLERHDCAVIGILHQNEDSGLQTKARGHIGSVLEQKVVSSIAIADRSGYFLIETTKLREGKQLKIRAVFNEQTEMLQSQVQEDLLPKIKFPCTASEFDEQLMNLTNKSENTVKKIRKDWERKERIKSQKEGKEFIFTLNN